MNNTFLTPHSVPNALNTYLKQYLETEGNLENFIPSVTLGDLAHYPVIFRNIEGKTNPFKDNIDETDLLCSVGVVKDATITLTTVYADYIFGYNGAYRASASYDAFKKTMNHLFNLVILDLQEKLNTSGNITGHIEGKFSDLENYAGYKISLVAKVGTCPPYIIDTNTADPAEYKKFNLSWTKK